MTDGYSVDAREAEGVLVGDGSTQINYFYNGTWMGGPTLPPLVGVSGRIESPYRGLSAFGERDAAFFFGRETTATDVLNRMDERLRHPGLMMVSGVSGAGKSSLVCAGVLPQLRGTGLASAPEAASWPCLVFTPTRAPLDELAVRIAPVAGADAAAIRRSLGADPADFALTTRQAASAQGRVVLIVDQFEQVFTQCDNEEERRAFLTALHAAASGEEPAALVVLVVRADFEARCADYADLRTAVQDRYLVTAMTERQMRVVITEPAVRAGFRVDADLVEVLLRETGSAGSNGAGTGVLPLLSHALDQAWRRREGTDLRLTDYERTGGVEGAVADSAKRAYDRLSPSQQAIARRIFIQLTTTTAGGVDTADRVDRADLTHGRGDDEVRDAEVVLESFAAERLITLAADTVQISHEVLLSAWPLLRDEWLAETHADRIIRARLHTAAAEWARNSGDPSYLYGGSLLQDVLAAADRIAANPARQPPLGAVEHAFIQASGRAHRRNRRLRQGLLATLGVLVIGLAAVTGVAVRTSREAIDQRDTAAADQAAIKSENLGGGDPVLSTLESVAAWRIKHTAETRYGMLAAAANPGIATFPGAFDEGAVPISPDGRILAVTQATALRLWDIRTHRPIRAPVSDVLSVAFSPDGRTLATQNEKGVQFWDVPTSRKTGELHPKLLKRGLSDPSNSKNGRFSLSYSPDGKYLVTGDELGTVRLWNVATRKQIGAPISTPAAPTGPVAFSPDSTTLATGDIDGRVRLWETATGHRRTDFDTGRIIRSMAFERDGRVATADETTVRVWNTSTGRPVTTLTAVPGGNADSIAFGPGGRVLATAGFGEPVQLWDTVTGRKLGPPIDGTSGPVAFGPHGFLASGGSTEGTVRLSDTTARPVGEPPVTTGPGAMAFAADGTVLTAESSSVDRVLMNTVNGRTAGGLPFGPRGKDVTSVAVSDDEKTAAVGGTGGTLQVWDMTSRHRIADLFDLTEATAMAFSHDGKKLAVGGDNGRISLWNVADHRHIANIDAGNGGVISLAFNPAGKILAKTDVDTEDIDEAVRLWEINTDRRTSRPLMPQVDDAALAPSGKTMITMTHGGLIQIWDTTTHRPISRFATAGASSPIALSPDEKMLATTVSEEEVQLWDIPTGRPIGPSLTFLPPAGTLAFSRDGKTLAHRDGNDDTVWRWHIGHLHDVLPRLCTRAGRSLTRAEWRRDIPPGPAYRPICADHR